MGASQKIYSNLTANQLNMFTRSTLLHLRIPFSFFLMPVFVFAWAIKPDVEISNLLWVFVTLHVFLYPASNGYNSYFDKDEKSIGGLKNPPSVTKDLYWAALIFDLVAILIGFIIRWEFALMLFIYGLVSKAYSHPAIRLKKHAFTSWFIAGFFQGAFTFVTAYIGLQNVSFSELSWDVFTPALLSSALLWGSYPMTQIYQHEEDAKRGDKTLSYRLGILGTFLFTGVVFSICCGLYFWYFLSYHTIAKGWTFLIFLAPVLVYFIAWFFQIVADEEAANYTGTMRLNAISAICLNSFFLYLGLS